VCRSHTSQGHASLVEVRAIVEGMKAEFASLSPAGARPPVLAEDLLCRPLREEAWGAAGVGALERCARVMERTAVSRFRFSTPVLCVLSADNPFVCTHARRNAEPVGRAMRVVALLREVYAQERRLVEVRARAHRRHPADPFRVEWRDEPRV